MSRIGRIPLPIPSGVQCSVKDRLVTVQGPKGSLDIKCPMGFSVLVDGDFVRVERQDEGENMSALHGTLCRNIRNMLIGVSQGFEKNLELIGVGYKAELQSDTLKLSLGYSHDIFYPVPQGIAIALEKPTLLKITGADKQKVGQTAAEIIRYRRPEPYKGKGVRVVGQFLRMKEGKTK